MTREQLDAIRARLDEVPFLPFEATLVFQLCANVRALLDEVEWLRDAHAMVVQVSGELCEKCGWAMKFPGEKCRCELLAEVERLTAERAALQVGDTESTTLEANERFAPSEHVVVYIEKWCDSSGPCAVELEPHGHWRLSRSVSLASVRKAERDAAFSRGVAAMREAARTYFVDESKRRQREGDGRMEVRYLRLAVEIRSLPDPEDTK